jgi:hypothetical protein
MQPERRLARNRSPDATSVSSLALAALVAAGCLVAVRLDERLD